MKVATATFPIAIGNPSKNIEEILKLAKQAEEDRISICVFPELSVTGYTCGDLFFQTHLLNETERAIEHFRRKTQSYWGIYILGIPFLFQNQLYNCAIVLQSGKILGIVPKQAIPNYNEFYEKRYFISGKGIHREQVRYANCDTIFDAYMLFESDSYRFGVEICEDLWTNISPSNVLTLKGADIICNLSASDEVIGKDAFRRTLVQAQSGKCICAYLYVSAGMSESTSDLVFSGHQIIAVNGSVIKETKWKEGNLICADLDVERLQNDRRKMHSCVESLIPLPEVTTVPFVQDLEEVLRPVSGSAFPFVPPEDEMEERCAEILKIQATGLATRMKKSGIHKAVIGISGGLDSTLALLVTVQAMKENGYPMKNIIGITMPGFGTTNRTKGNSLLLMEKLGITSRTIPIVDACLQHYKDIGHDPEVEDVTFENGQARERTQILMDIANQENALVIGTGDLSELALGWCTYNGDHMSNYAVNIGVPKTLVKYLVRAKEKEYEGEEVGKILHDILDTPVSPELLRPDKNGEIKQKTEESVGSYDLNDFFLYHMIRNNYAPKKIFQLAELVFHDRFTSEEIKESLNRFYKRFFTQQFKRNALPDGPKVGSVALSPRGDWRMPSDGDFGSFQL